MQTTMVAEPGKQEIVITRALHAPRELVFKTMTDPALIPQWWGPRNLTTVVEKMEVRPGGQWRFIQHDAEGNEYAFHGVYHDAVAPERMIYTFEFEGMPGHVLLTITTLEARGDETFVTDKSVFASIEDRDGMMQDGMEEGATETWDRLAELLERNAQV